MIKFNVRIWGKQVFKGAETFPENMSAIIKEALPSIGLLVEANCRDMCPVDTGRLRSSIGHYDRIFMVKENPDENPEDAHWVLGHDFVEIGTRVPYSAVVHDRAPYLEAGLRQSMQDIHEIIKAIMAKAVERTFGRKLRKKAITRGLETRLRHLWR